MTVTINLGIKDLVDRTSRAKLLFYQLAGDKKSLNTNHFNLLQIYTNVECIRFTQGRSCNFSFSMLIIQLHQLKPSLIIHNKIIIRRTETEKQFRGQKCKTSNESDSESDSAILCAHRKVGVI